ncbi:MAG: hypothetical protein AB1650_07120 [Candidatus Omnitrophota bacterium]
MSTTENWLLRMTGLFCFISDGKEIPPGIDPRHFNARQIASSSAGEFTVPEKHLGSPVAFMGGESQDCLFTAIYDAARQNFVKYKEFKARLLTDAIWVKSAHFGISSFENELIWWEQQGFKNSRFDQDKADEKVAEVLKEKIRYKLDKSPENTSIILSYKGKQYDVHIAENEKKRLIIEVVRPPVMPSAGNVITDGFINISEVLKIIDASLAALYAEQEQSFDVKAFMFGPGVYLSDGEKTDLQKAGNIEVDVIISGGDDESAAYSEKKGVIQRRFIDSVKETLEKQGSLPHMAAYPFIPKSFSEEQYFLIRNNGIVFKVLNSAKRWEDDFIYDFEKNSASECEGYSGKDFILAYLWLELMGGDLELFEGFKARYLTASPEEYRGIFREIENSGRFQQLAEASNDKDLLRQRLNRIRIASDITVKKGGKFLDNLRSVMVDYSGEKNTAGNAADVTKEITPGGIDFALSDADVRIHDKNSNTAAVSSDYSFDMEDFQGFTFSFVEPSDIDSFL